MKDIIVRVLLGISLLSYSQVHAQFIVPDCCEQASKLTQERDAYANKYNETLDLLEKTRKSGERLKNEKDARIEELIKLANSKIVQGNKSQEVLVANVNVKQGAVDQFRKNVAVELTKRRFFGIGRRAWLEQQLLLLTN